LSIQGSVRQLRQFLKRHWLGQGAHPPQGLLKVRGKLQEVKCRLLVWVHLPESPGDGGSLWLANKHFDSGFDHLFSCPDFPHYGVASIFWNKRAHPVHDVGTPAVRSDDPGAFRRDRVDDFVNLSGWTAENELEIVDF